MSLESRCGLVCSQCEYKEQVSCPTCVVMEKPFWGEECPVKSCCEEKEHEHCGQCEEIPCDILTAMSNDAEQGDNGERISRCGEWQAQTLKEQMMEYALSKPGTTTDYKEEWGWDRVNVGDKLFLAFARMREERPITTVKLKPEHGDFLRRQNPDVVIPGFYMNKEHWNTIYLDLPWSLVFFIPLIDEAYDLVLGSLTKKKQKEIMGEE